MPVFIRGDHWSSSPSRSICLIWQKAHIGEGWMAKVKPKSPFTGRWQIVLMDAWDVEEDLAFHRVR